MLSHSQQHQQNMQYLEINLTKGVKGMNNENYKYLLKETEDTNRWKDILHSWIIIIIIVKMAILSKAIYRL